jgi:hypothetical protein
VCSSFIHSTFHLLAIQHFCQELGSPDDLLVAGGIIVHLLHDPDALEIELHGDAPVELFQLVDALGVGIDTGGVQL